jgi:predicted PurR-regulated permease PerM
VKEKGSISEMSPAHYFLLALVIVSLYGCYQIIKPYLNAVVLALLLSIVFHPLHERIENRTKGRRSLAAGISCALLTFVVVLPMMLMVVAVIAQGIESFNAIYGWLAAGKFEEAWKWPLVVWATETADAYLPNLKKFFPDLELSLAGFSNTLLQLSQTMGKKLLSQGGQLLGNLTAIVINFTLMIFVFFFSIRDYHQLFDWVMHLVPLSASQESEILSKIRAVSRSAILGTLVTAAAQGLAGGLAFWICGLPGLFWGTAMAFASLIPVVGTALIWVPAATYLFLAGRWGFGIFMVLWSVVVVGMIDNLVRPLFMQGSANMSTLLIFFSILGGIQQFGLIGLLYGPLIFGLAMVLLYIYSLEFKAFLDHQDRS